ncbi:MAG: substrate-binding domain-containing protein [Acidobacteriota bacterium]|nr:substrate-binding domain-containing protein [Acidobacteriota bacterium]
MSGRKSVLPIVLLFSLALLLSCGGKSGEDAGITEPGRMRIAVIPKGMTHEFWKAIHAGALEAARELDVDIIWKGPQKEDDRSQQVMVVEDFANRGVDGIVLAPLDDRALVRPVRDAARQGIPVVVIDSGLQGEHHVSFVATDNFKGGVLAARRLGGLLGGRGDIFLLRYQVGSASTTERERGFLETVRKEFPDLRLLVQDQYAGATTESAYQLAENLLNRFPGVQGIFAPNESSTFGTLRALQDSGRAGQVLFVGFDSSAKLVQGLRDGHLHGLVLQNPMKMGYLGVMTLVAHLRGEPVDPLIDTGVFLATPNNMDDPEIVKLLNPGLSGLD